MLQQVTGDSELTLCRVNVNGPRPIPRRLIFQDDVGFGEKLFKAACHAEFLGGFSGTVSPAGTPAIKLHPGVAQIPDTSDCRRHGKPLGSGVSDKGVIHIHEDV